MRLQNERTEKCSYLHPHNEVIKVMTFPTGTHVVLNNTSVWVLLKADPEMRRWGRRLLWGQSQKAEMRKWGRRLGMEKSNSE